MPRRLDLPCHELCARYMAGHSTTSLARQYQCSPTTICKYLHECGVAMRPSRFTGIAVDAALLKRAYLDERLPIAEIAARFRVSPSTIGNKRRRYGIPLRSR
jgi:uncharacterized protein YjcR